MGRCENGVMLFRKMSIQQTVLMFNNPTLRKNVIAGYGTIFTLLNHKNCAIYSCSKKLKDLLEWTHKEEAMLSLTATYDEFESLITKQHSYELFETIIEKKRKEYSTMLAGES